MQTNTCLLINETDVTPAEVRVDDDEIMEIFTAWYDGEYTVCLF